MALKARRLGRTKRATAKEIDRKTQNNTIFTGFPKVESLHNVIFSSQGSRDNDFFFVKKFSFIYFYAICQQMVVTEVELSHVVQ